MVLLLCGYPQHLLGSYRRSSTPSPRDFTTVYLGHSRPLQNAGAFH